MGVKGRGESVFVSFFLILTLRAFEPIMLHFGDDEAVAHYRALADTLLRALDEHALCLATATRARSATTARRSAWRAARSARSTCWRSPSRR